MNTERMRLHREMLRTPSYAWDAITLSVQADLEYTRTVDLLTSLVEHGDAESWTGSLGREVYCAK